MRALVTGSSGFVGSHLAEELVRQNCTVRVILRGGARFAPWLKDLPLECAEAEYTNPESLQRALRGVDIVFHAGGVTKALTPNGYIDGNVLPTKALLEAASVEKNIRRFVLVSSLAVMSPASGLGEPVREDDVPRPVEAYGRSKLIAELVARAYSDRVPITIIRPPAVYGPRDRDFLKVFALIQKHVNPYYGNAKKYTSIIHARDLVDGMIRAALSPQAAGRAYFLCNDEPLSWRELQTAMKTAMQRRALDLYLPGCTPTLAAWCAEPISKLTKKPSIINREKARLGRPRYWIASNERARAELGFDPKISLIDGLAETYRWYTENGWL
ncbi:MAG: NAD-dependent epimerase/dehydratase family protein [Spirochaetota bacterium]|jgi:nucleoside-diphosphate-sugar epimerase|nr:NAD-dependent epimerase/dehydratase family protein [Spirochaetota bacterium]